MPQRKNCQPETKAQSQAHLTQQQQKYTKVT